jgi:hypothetical protein
VKSRRGRGEGGEEGDKRGRKVFKRCAACGFGLWGVWGAGRIGDRFVLEVNSDSVLKQKEYLIICHVLFPFGNIRCFSFIKWMYLDIF